MVCSSCGTMPCKNGLGVKFFNFVWVWHSKQSEIYRVLKYELYTTGKLCGARKNALTHFATKETLYFVYIKQERKQEYASFVVKQSLSNVNDIQ